MAHKGWRVLRGGSGRGAVLTIDFTLARVRAQANFADLAPGLPDGFTVWATDEAVWPVTPGDPQGQLDDWLRRGCEVDPPVRAVLAYCASASLATALASRLAAGGDRAPTVILFDPTMVGAQALVDQAEASMLRLDGAKPSVSDGMTGHFSQLDNDIGNEFHALLPHPATRDEFHNDIATPAQLADLATGLARRYATRAAEVGVSQSIPASIVDQLCRRVEANLRFLTLCATAWSHDGAVPDLVVLSRDREIPAALPPVPTMRLDVAENELLSDPRSSEAATRLLSDVHADGRA